ncbi:dual specificity protein phosphatase 16-like [Lineus longissimus]|uniref:dual specificity protein phosphatase 16-like n=1 Tax=Lineus longissimus TaxID=88925 RepID=UPI002B4EC47F
MLIKLAMATDSGRKWGTVSSHQLSEVIRREDDKVLIIDSRSFLEYNTCNILRAVNICCSKLVKRRLQQDKVSILELLSQTCHIDAEAYTSVIVYDQCTESSHLLAADCFLVVLCKKLQSVFKKVNLLKGGFLEFQAAYPSLCENKGNSDYKCASLSSMSQPCLPINNIGPTKILPFLFLGSQHDAFSQECTKMNGITYILNVSTTCPKPTFIQEGHFLRIPVNDNYNDKLLPHFYQAFQYIDKVREANGCVLVHCLAGISRSPTLAIAYLMRYLKMSSDEAYKYVKDKRPTISPNFNFLGQLLEYEKQLKREASDNPHDSSQGGQKRHCVEGATSLQRRPAASTSRPTGFSNPRFPVRSFEDKATVSSPTTALSKLNFNPSTPEGATADLPYPTTSLDKLNFTPCFVKEDGSTSSGQKRSAAVKRPLSLSSVPDVLHFEEKDPQITSSCHSEKNEVVMRSPEARAKRPLKRPNSISFSSYPKFDFGNDQTVVDSPEASQDDSVPVVKTLHESLPCPHPSRERLLGPEKMGLVPLGTSKKAETYNCQSVKSCEQRRKSRSLDDILTSSDDDSPRNSCDCTVIENNLKQSSGERSMDLFTGSIGGLEKLRCVGTTSTDPHQSSSSISSGGSHNSLHGSLELIPVS